MTALVLSDWNSILSMQSCIALPISDADLVRIPPLVAVYWQRTVFARINMPLRNKIVISSGKRSFGPDSVRSMLKIEIIVNASSDVDAVGYVP